MAHIATQSVSKEKLLILKRYFLLRFVQLRMPTVAQMLCWLLDQTDNLTRSVAVFVPEAFSSEGRTLSLGFRLLENETEGAFVALMGSIGSRMFPRSYTRYFVGTTYDATRWGYTLKFTTSAVNPDEVEIPFDLAVIQAVPLTV
jgi:hypothetical protein